MARKKKMQAEACLFTMSHRHDPHTSKRAAREFVKSGKLKTHFDIIVQAVHDHPGLTAHELERYTGLTYVQIDRRTKDLEDWGRIVRHGERNNALCLWPPKGDGCE